MVDKIKSFIKDTLIPKLSGNKFFLDKNGKPSSKRLAGLFIVANSMILAYLSGLHFFTLETSLILGVLAIGASLLGMPKDQVL